MSQLTNVLEQKLADEAGLAIAVEEDRGTLVLTGMIGSENQRLAAIDIVSEAAPGRAIQDNLETDIAMPSRIGGMDVSETEVGAFPGAEPDTEEDEAIEPGNFADQPEMTDPLGASGAGATELGPDGAAEGNVVYTPPIDPVGTDREAIGGFEASAEDALGDVAPRGDEQIADEVRIELRDDSATTDLAIDVQVEGQRVRLRGRVPTIDDADNAAAVASRVGGVVEVIDALEVEAGRIV